MRDEQKTTVFDKISAANARLINLTCDGDTEFLDTELFPWVTTVEAASDQIREELDALLQTIDDLPAFQDVSPRQQALSSDQTWKTYFFKVYGRPVPEALESCPRTASILSGIPNMSTAMFSILTPGKHVAPHTGPHKGVLRYQLGLHVPSEDPQQCGIRVGGQTRGWAAGRSMIFDDTQDHEAWNRTDDLRSVLFVDFLRPMPKAVSQLNRFLGWAVSQLSKDVGVAHRNAREYARSLSRTVPTPQPDALTDA